MTEIVQIKVPDIGDVDAVDVIEVLVAPGDTVEEETPLLTLETDKATMEVPSPAAGVVDAVHVSVGDKVSEGHIVVDLKQVAGEAAAEALATEAEPEEAPAAAESAPESAAPEQVAAPAASGSNSHQPVPEFSGSIHASPSVRRLARELSLDLNQVEGTGRKGRITHDDVHGLIKQELNRSKDMPAAAGAGLAVAAAPQVDFSKFGEVETRPLSRIQKLSGANLHRNWVSIPHVTQHDEADITDLEGFRKAHDAMAREQGTRLTLLVFLIKSCVAALKQFPHFNASLAADGESLVYKNYFHIGIAVDTPNGLVVPVIRDCDQKSLLELAQELTVLSGKARDGKLAPKEMQGGCFSISSLGGIGGTGFTPIINAPEVAILGVSRSSMKPVWDGEGFDPRLMLPLSLSYDHRVIDGADAARFTRFLATRLEDFRRVML